MRISKYQERMLRKQLPKAGDGEGRFIYENNSGSDLMLPGRKTMLRFDHKTKKGDQFEGTDYYKQFVGKGLKIVRVLETKEQKQEAEETMNDKLITEQPPTVTDEGKVEFVEKNKDKKKEQINETPSDKVPEFKEDDDVLLNETPVDDSGIEIV